jgi:hypothetical protein
MHASPLGVVRLHSWWRRLAAGRTPVVAVLAVGTLTAAAHSGTQLRERGLPGATLSTPRDTGARRLGPFDILLFPTPAAPQAKGRGRLVFADSPFGVAFTEDGHAQYNIQITASSLPAPSTLGKYSVYQAWAVSPDLAHWVLLGLVSNGTTTVGSVDFNKFIVTVIAAPDSASTSHDGPSVLHGTSPSGWLQLMFTEPEFHGVNQ